MIVTILAGGYSASQCDLKRLPGTVIAVNDAAIYAPRWDVAISMDRLWLENRFPKIKAMDSKTLWGRMSASRNLPVTDGDICNLPERFRFKTFHCDHESTVLSDAPYRFNGTHSGFCALNLAYQMRPDHLFLVGFDMQLGPRGEQHWYPPYPWKNGGGTKAGKLAEWAQQFTTAQRQLAEAKIDVALVSHRWTVPGFRIIKPEELNP